MKSTIFIIIFFVVAIAFLIFAGNHFRIRPFLTPIPSATQSATLK